MFNLILTLSVYTFMTVTAAVLLTIIIYRQEQWISETVLSEFNTYPISIFHRDSEADQQMQVFYPVSFESTEVYIAKY
jgi:hypothetical protein